MTFALPRQERALRMIALFEGLKGFAALMIGIGLVELLQHDLRQLMLELMGHFGLELTQPFSATLLHYADVLNGTPLGTLELFFSAYLVIRFAEAWGLWHGKVWAEFLGTFSGGVYIPFELHHLWHSPSAHSLGVFTFNVLIVGFLSKQLWRRRAVTA